MYNVCIVYDGERPVTKPTSPLRIAAVDVSDVNPFVRCRYGCVQELNEKKNDDDENVEIHNVYLNWSNWTLYAIVPSCRTKYQKTLCQVGFG